MIYLEDYLNVRNSTRNLSNEQFEEILPELARQLEATSFYPTYTTQELMSDWEKLKQWHPTPSIASTQRLGMKLCEHFFPNFYEIEDKNGVSFKKLWVASNLEKVLRWNRKSHSTPYLSELKRGIYFNFGLTKSTMYRPQMSKAIVSHYDAKIVLDPCAGWGGRMIGAIAGGAEQYIAFEPNTQTYVSLLELAKFLGIENKVTIYHDSALNMANYNIPTVDLSLTSPPYFDLEVYSHEDTQSITGCSSYEDWINKFLYPLIQLVNDRLITNGTACWNVHNVGKMKMINDVDMFYEIRGYGVHECFSVVSSKRQTNQYTASKNTKNSDLTTCYKKYES